MENQPPDTQVDGNSLNQKEVTEAQSLVQSLIRYIGDDPDREGLFDTPKRVVKSWKEIFGGYKMDPAKVLGTTFEKNGYEQMVICKDIELFSTCEHHMIPFFGKAHIGYVPGDRVVGLSKLARLVEVYSRRLQIQEKLTQQIANTLNEVLKPKGVMVVIEAKHMCMCSRGVQKQHSSMVTSAMIGVFNDQGSRTEFMGLIR